jgi:hypothetical protein
MLRVDFLRHHKLAMDAPTGHLIHTETLARQDTSLTESTGELSFILASTLAPGRTLFSELPEVTSSSGNFPPPKHGVEHHIVIFGRPVSLRFSRLDPEKQLAAKKEFAEIEAADIICRYNDCWSSSLRSLHMVRKANVSWRPSGEL